MTADHWRTRRRRRNRVAAAIAGLLLGLLSVAFSPASPASAHAVLQRTSPAAQATVPEAPAEVTLTFSEAVRLLPGKIRVIAPDGGQANSGEASADGSTVTVPLNSTAARGTYLVSYRVISADSHPVAGAFTFSVGAPSTAPTLDDGQEAHPAVTTAIPIAKYLGYAGLVLVVGPVLVLLFLWPMRLARRGPARLVTIGLSLIGLSTLAALWLQAPYTNGIGLFDASFGELGDVLSSGFGTTMLVRLGLLVVIAIMLRPLLAERTDGRTGDSRADMVVLGILGAATVATWPLTGHPAASPVPAVSVVVDAVHLVSMAVWLGGLVMLVGFLLRQADERELSAILPIWSRWAALAVTALLVGGLVQALIEVATPTALVNTTYGQLILAKAALFALVIGVAAYSRRLVRRRIAAGQPNRIRTAILAEVAITAVVLAVSSVLVQTTPARTSAANTDLTGTGYFSIVLDSPLYSLQVEIDPAEVGNNSLHLYAYQPGGTLPVKVEEWQTTASLPAAGIEPIEAPMLKLTDNHAISEVQLPAAGTWEIRFTLRTTEIDQATVTATVPIK